MSSKLKVGIIVGALFTSGGATAQSAIPYAYSVFGTTQPVNLGGAGHFVILSKSGITDVPSSDVVGNIGTSPITGAADHLSCAEVTGNVYSVDAAGPAPCSLKTPARLTTAVSDMQTAYTDAAGRRAGAVGLDGGNIGGRTFGPGVYKWSTSVNIGANLTLNGDSYSVWIFQIAQNLTLADGKAIILSGNAQAQNIFWQVAGSTTLGTTSHFEGIVLCKTLVAMKTGASINGRLYAQTAVTLQMNHVTAP
jgi:Ice-binding-like